MRKPLPLEPLHCHCKIEIDRLNLAKDRYRYRYRKQVGYTFSNVPVAAKGGVSVTNTCIYQAPNASRDGDTTDNRKRIRPLENAPPDCPHCRDAVTGEPVAMVEGLNESGHERLACPACGLVAVEVLAGGQPHCKQCGKPMQIVSTLITNTATAIEYACPVCDLGNKGIEP